MNKIFIVDGFSRQIYADQHLYSGIRHLTIVQLNLLNLLLKEAIIHGVTPQYVPFL